MNRPEAEDESILSSTFSVSGPHDKKTDWMLRLYPRARENRDDDSDGIVSLFLVNKEKDSVEKISFCLSLLNGRLQKEKTLKVCSKDINELYQEGYSEVGVEYLISREALEASPHLLPDGNLTVVCDLTVYGPEATLSGSKYPTEKLIPVDNCLKQMSEQFGKHFGSQEFTDVKLMSGNEVFHCHKFILSVRSPVFKAMFQATGMREEISDEVAIKDMSPEIVREMLHFIYTGTTSTEIVMDEIGKELLGAAEMYQLDLLKNKCEEKLCSSLDVSNSVELLVLADLHQASKLRRIALSLVAKNMDTIVNTDVYKNFIAHHPILALEITKVLVQKAGMRSQRDNGD